MGGPNEKEIGLCMWKQIGTFCCFNWSRHCINVPQAKYLFSVHSQIEPSIIIVYPWVRTSPKRRFLFSGWAGCSFHYIAKNVLLGLCWMLGSVMFVRTPMCLDLLCPKRNLKACRPWSQLLFTNYYYFLLSYALTTNSLSVMSPCTL